MLAFITVLELFVLTIVIAEKPSTCPDGYATAGSKCYAVIPLNVTWPVAQSVCETFGGDLLTLGDVNIKTDFVNFLTQYESTLTGSNGQNLWYWMDMNRLLNTAKWRESGRDGDPITYFQWSSGQPTSSCLGIQCPNCAAINKQYGMAAEMCLSNAFPVCELHLRSNTSPDLIG